MVARAARVGILLAASGCFSPYEPACGFICGPDGACPADYTCQADQVCHKNGTPADAVCVQPPEPFDVSTANALSNIAVAVTFDGVPNAAEAEDAANYAIAGLPLTGDVVVMGNMIVLGTSSQSAMSYVVTVSGVHRLGDMQPLTVASATFTGRSAFDLASAASLDATHVTVTFDAAPAQAQAEAAASYAIAGLTITGATLAGNTATLVTSAQAEQSYTVDVTGVTRASDGERLAVTSATFADYCIDGTPDGDETDQDCGGPTCTARCADTKTCALNSDCTSGNCALLVCAP